MSSDATPTPQSEPETTPEQYRQRALLLADLGRYDEATGEIAAGLAVAASDPDLLVTLARLHLVAEQPAAALTAADRAAAAAPDTIGPWIMRAMALADVQRFGEVARIGSEIIARWPDDAYAQRVGAGLLSESRNGQEALNAAWTAVKLAPTDADAHLVLAVVSARLRLFELAQRAYAEALDLDPALGEAQHDIGVVHLERRRWARALEALADAAALSAPTDMTLPPASGEHAPPTATPGRALPPPVARPSGSVLDTSAETGEVVRRGVLIGANATMIAGLVTALMAAASSGASRVWAAMIGVILLATLLGWLVRKLDKPLGTALHELRRSAPRLPFALYAACAAPMIMVSYAALGGPIPLVTALLSAATAELLVLTSRP